MSEWLKVFRDMVVPMLGISSSALAWTNMPAGVNEFYVGAAANPERLQHKVDLTNYKSVRLVANVITAGVAGSKLRGQYSLNEIAWDYLDGATGPECDIDATGVEESTWVTITALAQDDVYLRLVGVDGDGVADPKFGYITLQFK